MKDKPLEYKEFEAAKLVVELKYKDDLCFRGIPILTYETYLMARWHMKRLKGNQIVCAVDPSHDVTGYYSECRVSEVVKTGVIEIDDHGGNEDYSCEQCLGLKQQLFVWEGVMGDFEELA